LHACAFQLRPQGAVTVWEIGHNLPLILYFVTLIFPRLPQLLYPVPLRYRGVSARAPRGAAGCRRRAAELRAVSQASGQTGTRGQAGLVMNPAKGVIGASCHRKIDMGSEIASPPHPVGVGGRGDKRKERSRFLKKCRLSKPRGPNHGRHRLEGLGLPAGGRSPDSGDEGFGSL
jgi:hypothetical protein